MADKPRMIGTPEPGFYRVRLVRHAMWVAVRIWADGHGALRVEVNGRSTRNDGKDLDVNEVWPWCHPISPEEFEFLDRRRAWAEEHVPDHPAADPRSPIDVRKLKPGW